MSSKWTLEGVNSRLKAGKIGVVVCQRGDRLSLRATMPAKPGSHKTGCHQQYLALGIYANPAGLQRAEAEAKLLGGLLARGEFTWERYRLNADTQEEENLKTCEYWIEKFKQEYFAKNGITPTKQQTWKRHYLPYFDKLPPKLYLTAEILTQLISRIPANTWSRKTACQKLEQLAKFAGIEVDLKKYRGNYSSSKQIIRQLPSDEEIEAIRNSIIHPEWQWAFGAIATYGLRPHEVFFATISKEAPYVCVIDEGKTGARIAFPLLPRWAIDWQLWENKKPSKINLEGITWKDLGNRIYKALKRYKISCTVYDLRHSYAVRAATKFKFPVAIVSQWMGHSAIVHLREYQRHITQIDQLEIFLSKAKQLDCESD